MSRDLALGAMGVTGVTVFLAEGYLNNYQNWIVAKTHGTAYTQQASTQDFWKWAFGLGVVTVVLVAGSDSDQFGELAGAFAVLIAGGVLLKKGGQAITNLKNLVVSGGGASTSSGSSSSDQTISSPLNALGGLAGQGTQTLSSTGLTPPSSGYTAPAPTTPNLGQLLNSNGVPNGSATALDPIGNLLGG